MPDTDERLKLRSLILEAFDAARSSGKPDWWRMQTGVLKNRMLQATERHFTEAEFGFDSFAALVEGLPELLRPVAGSRPPAIELTDSIRASLHTGGVEQPTATISGRIRSDLWRAILDYSSSGVWIWDAGIGMAVPGDGESVGPTMPTVDAVVLSEWRREFSRSVADETGLVDAVTTWADRGLPTAALPKPLQSSWNAFLKAKSLERLTTWFATQGIPFPADSIERNRPAKQDSAPTGSALRRYVHECIDAMTDDEVRALSIPVGVALRVHR